MQVLGEGPGPGHGAHVRGDHHHVLALGAELLGVVVHKDGLAGQVVHRDVEEALDLGGMEVHGQHPVGAGGGDHVGHKFRGDGVPRLGLAVLPGIAKIGDHRRNASGGGPLQSIDEDQKLHQVVVHRRAGGLDHKRVAAADRLVHGGENLAVREGPHLGLTQFGTHQPADLVGQLRIGVAGEYLDVLAVRNHFQALFSIKIFIKYCSSKKFRSLSPYRSFPWSFRRRAAQPSRFFCRLLATPSASGGTSSVMVLPAAV